MAENIMTQESDIQEAIMAIDEMELAPPPTPEQTATMAHEMTMVIYRLAFERVIDPLILNRAKISPGEVGNILAKELTNLLNSERDKLTKTI